MELQLQKMSLMRLEPGEMKDTPCVETEDTASIYYNAHSLQHGKHCVALPEEERFRSLAFQQNIAMTYGILRHVPGALINFAETLKGFQELPHRQNCFVIHNTISYVDDSKATTPEACVQALMRWSCPIFWIAGGVKQKDDLCVLEPYLGRVKQAFLYGESAERFREFLEPRSVSCKQFGAMEDAVYEAWNAAQFYKNVVVLCSPGVPVLINFQILYSGEKLFNTVYTS